MFPKLQSSSLLHPAVIWYCVGIFWFSCCCYSKISTLSFKDWVLGRHAMGL